MIAILHLLSWVSASYWWDDDLKYSLLDRFSYFLLLKFIPSYLILSYLILSYLAFSYFTLFSFSNQWILFLINWFFSPWFLFTHCLSWEEDNSRSSIFHFLCILPAVLPCIVLFARVIIFCLTQTTLIFEWKDLFKLLVEGLRRR